MPRESAKHPQAEPLYPHRPGDYPPATLEPSLSQQSDGSATLAPAADATATRADVRARLAGAGLFVAGAGVVLLLMANERQIPHSVLAGSVALLVAALGLTRALGLLEPARGELPSLLDKLLAPIPGEPVWARPRRTLPAALAWGALSGVMLAVAPSLRAGGIPVALATGLILLSPSALRRPGLGVFVVGAMFSLPWLGTFGLWDPWETHYGEVAREILSRDDWISLWWAQDRWFWSKPIFIFWAEALVWNALGVTYQPDSFPRYVEWVLRIPTFVVAMGALLAVYGTLARIYSRRAGFLAALVLLTMPHFSFLSHQAITDMPFVGCMTIAICSLLCAFHVPEEQRVQAWRLGPYAVSLRTLVVAGLVMLVLPQALYLVSRNVTLVDYHLFAWHGDLFWHGSAGNEGVPGNAGFHQARPYARAAYLQPAVQALVWLAGLGFLVWRVRRQHHLQALVMVGFYAACALAFMAKGIPGFALPGLVALLLLIASGRWRLLWEGRLHVGAGILTIAVIGLPWFVAMYMRHGPPFTDRLLIHDHVNRLAEGVHGDKGSIAYFLRQLGYAAFPWIGLLPAAIGQQLRARRAPPASASARRQDSMHAVLLWCIATFTLFSAMMTKFHHYIFPVVPAAAMMVGVLLDRLLDEAPPVGKAGARSGAAYLLAGSGALIAVLGVGGWFGDVRGVLPTGVTSSSEPDWVLSHGWPPLVAVGVALLGAALFALALRLEARTRNVVLPRNAPAFEATGPAAARASLAFLTAAVLCAFIGRDLSWVTGTAAGYERLIHLFVYNYERPWPEHLDYRPVLTGFAVVICLVLGAAAFARLRRVALAGLFGLALGFSVFCVHVYMRDLTPHWSQRQLVARYFAEREGPHEPLVAWQMNWKGENLYTGNRVAVFVKLDNREIEAWMKGKQDQTAFFLLEHTRLRNFERMMGDRQLRRLTTKRDNNKFILVEALL